MTDSAQWLKVATLADIPDGKIKPVLVNKQSIALYNIGGDIYATDNICSHAFALLSDGYLDGDLIVCPLHAGCFEVKTGKAVEAPAEDDIKTYPVRIVGDEVQIDMAG